MGLSLTKGTAVWGDYDNDGWVDLYAAGTLWRNNKGRSFTKVMNNGAGIWGDYDNDGDLDLYLTTVYAVGSGNIRNYPVLYRNDGNWHFTDVTAQEGLAELPPTYQAAWADFDNDGDLDLISAARLFVNMANNNNWIKVHLAGDGKNVNSAAIGAQVRICMSDRIIARQVEAGTGEGNQNDMTLHFGLGKWDEPIPTVEIVWPNGVVQKIHKVRPNTRLEIRFRK
ncbi:hypothetical protein ES703_26595 [subsurface metagenome]